MQHLGLEGAFSASFRNAEGRTALRGGDRGVLDSWGRSGGVRFGTEEATQPGSVPVGLLCSCLRRGRRGRAGCCGPSCTAPAFPSTIYSQVRMLPTSPNPPEQGDTLQVLKKRKQRGELQPHSASRIAAAWSCSLLQREPFAPPPPTPISQLLFGGAGRVPPCQASYPCSWGSVPTRAGKAALKESTRFQAKGNWSTLSFRCL